jgi:hypothetical protein
MARSIELICFAAYANTVGEGRDRYEIRFTAVEELAMFGGALMAFRTSSSRGGTKLVVAGWKVGQRYRTPDGLERVMILTLDPDEAETMRDVLAHTQALPAVFWD